MNPHYFDKLQSGMLIATESKSNVVEATIEITGKYFLGRSSTDPTAETYGIGKYLFIDEPKSIIPISLHDEHKRTVVAETGQIYELRIEPDIQTFIKHRGVPWRVPFRHMQDHSRHMTNFTSEYYPSFLAFVKDALPIIHV